MQTFSGILTLIGGLGIFLIGMKIITIKLQSVAGDKAKSMLSKISDSSLAGLGIGAGAGFILESSSATTVILLSLVDAGIVTLMQATLIIMGSNIGTTLTVFLFSLNTLPIGEIFGALTAVGAGLVMSAKKEKTKAIGWIIAAIAMIFVGLNVMDDGVEKIQTAASLSAIIENLDSPILFLFIGVLFTAVLQSGSATTGIVITLCCANVLPLTAAFYTIIGSNIGSCVTAIIGCFGAGINAGRTAMIHLIFNVIGGVIFTPILICFGEELSVFLSARFSASVSIAYFHTAFNLATALILLPFVKQVVELAIWLVPDGKKSKKIPRIAVWRRKGKSQ